MTRSTSAPLRVKGHALRTEWSGEYGAESTSTGFCRCGKWQESASSVAEVRFEYRCHLEDTLRKHAAATRDDAAPGHPGTAADV